MAKFVKDDSAVVQPERRRLVPTIAYTMRVHKPAADGRSVKRRLERERWDKREAFLAAFARTASITQAAKASHTDRISHYDWLKKSPEYAEKFRKLVDIAADALEDEAVRRAMDGSDALLLNLLRAWKPDKYRHKTEISGPNGLPIPAKIEVVFVNPDGHDGGSDDSEGGIPA